MFSAYIGDWHPRFTFFEDFDDLAFAVPASFHVWLLFYQLCPLILGTILGEPYHFMYLFLFCSQGLRWGMTRSVQFQTIKE